MTTKVLGILFTYFTVTFMLYLPSFLALLFLAKNLPETLKSRMDLLLTLFCRKLEKCKFKRKYTSY